MSKLSPQQALEDSKTIWHYMSLTGDIKRFAIRKLYAKRAISQPKYDHCCPLCEVFNDTEKEEGICAMCPWPGEGGCRCEDFPSPFSRYAKYYYGDNYKQEDRKRFALKVYLFINTFKLKENSNG